MYTMSKVGTFASAKAARSWGISAKGKRRNCQSGESALFARRPGQLGGSVEPCVCVEIYDNRIALHFQEGHIKHTLVKNRCQNVRRAPASSNTI